MDLLSSPLAEAVRRQSRSVLPLAWQRSTASPYGALLSAAAAGDALALVHKCRAIQCRSSCVGPF